MGKDTRELRRLSEEVHSTFLEPILAPIFRSNRTWTQVLRSFGTEEDGFTALVNYFIQVKELEWAVFALDPDELRGQDIRDPLNRLARALEKALECHPTGRAKEEQKELVAIWLKIINEDIQEASRPPSDSGSVGDFRLWGRSRLPDDDVVKMAEYIAVNPPHREVTAGRLRMSGSLLSEAQRLAREWEEARPAGEWILYQLIYEDPSEAPRLAEMFRGDQIGKAQRQPQSKNSPNDKAALFMDCQGCGKRLRLPASSKDITIRCPNCGTHKKISGQG